MVFKKGREVRIQDMMIGDYHEPKFIAEIGVNHLGSIERMKNMIKLSHQAGADFLKFQTYKADTRYDLKSNPKAKEFINLTASWQLSDEENVECWTYAKSLGARVFTSVYDTGEIKFCMDMGTIAFKIAAFELVNLKLVNAVAETKLPIIASVGMASEIEIDKFVKIVSKNNTPYILLHCVSSYPLEKKFSYLENIHTLKNRYGCPVGHSDHTYGIEIPSLAVACGASIIEKHFTDNIKLRQSDNFFSVTSDEVMEIKQNTKRIFSFMHNKNEKTEDYMRDFKKYID